MGGRASCLVNGYLIVCTRKIEIIDVMMYVQTAVGWMYRAAASTTMVPSLLLSAAKEASGMNRSRVQSYFFYFLSRRQSKRNNQLPAPTRSRAQRMDTKKFPFVSRHKGRKSDHGVPVRRLAVCPR